MIEGRIHLAAMMADTAHISCTTLMHSFSFPLSATKRDSLVKRVSTVYHHHHDGTQEPKKECGQE